MDASSRNNIGHNNKHSQSLVLAVCSVLCIVIYISHLNNHSKPSLWGSPYVIPMGGPKVKNSYNIIKAYIRLGLGLGNIMLEFNENKQISS